VQHRLARGGRGGRVVLNSRRLSRRARTAAKSPPTCYNGLGSKGRWQRPHPPTRPLSRRTMFGLQFGAFPLFRVAGIAVYLHWPWLVVASLVVKLRLNNYNWPAWNLVEYLSLFVIVLLHEFGHALACRSVGGEAERIILWPLGGVAYVLPPPR